MTARDRRPSGTITVTAPLMIVMGPFTKALAGFRTAYPEIDVRVRVTTDLLNLHRRESDVALRATDSPDEGLFGQKLSGQRAAYYAAADYLSARAQCTRRAHQRQWTMDWIGRDEEERPPAEITARFPKAQIAVRMDDKLAALAAVKAGLGICRLPCFQGDSDPALRRVPGLPA